MPISALFVTSQNQQKLNPVGQCFPDSIIIGRKVAAEVEQPFGSHSEWKRHSLLCANQRIEKLLEDNIRSPVQYIVSIENGIVKDPNFNIYWDVTDVIIYDLSAKKKYSTLHMPFDKMIKVPVPKEVIEEFVINPHLHHVQTAGQLIKEKNGSRYDDKGNWMGVIGIDRKDQIMNSLRYVISMLPQNLENSISQEVRLAEDFPQVGVVFQDYQKIFGNPKLGQLVCNHLITDLHISNPSDYIVAGPELRGVMLGPMMAELIGCQFVMIRKVKGNGKPKIPPPIEKENLLVKEYKENYEEYFYCSPDLIEGKKVIFFDDVIASGGSALACCKLIEKCQGELVRLCFLGEVEDLIEDRKALMACYNDKIHSVMTC